MTTRESIIIMGNHSITFSFPIDQNTYALALMCLSGLFGVIPIVYGSLLITHRLRESRWLGRESMAQDLVWWSNGAIQTSEQRGEIVSQLLTLIGWAVVGGGLGWLLAIIIECVVVLSLTGALDLLISGGATFITIVQFQVAALGITLGFLVGSRRSTHRLSTNHTYADLRKRRASDYRMWWMAWGPELVALSTLFPLWLLATQTKRITLTLGYDHWSFPTAATVGVFILVGALIPVAASVFVHWLVVSPRTLIASDSQAARGADDFRRALSIGSVLGMAWMSSGILLQAVMSVTTMNLTGHEQPLTSILLTIGYFLGTGSFLIGLFITLLRGRLGGQLARRRRHIPTNGGAGQLAHD